MKQTLQWAVAIVIGLCLTFTASEKSFAQGATVVIGKEGEFKLGMRMQFKYAYKEPDNSSDFMIRRTRLKAEGSIFSGTKFKLEYKVDDVGQEGKNPQLKAEDVSFFINGIHPNVNIRIGLFDAPFSRDALTSDSKLLFMDRSDLFEGYKSEGLADNVIGASFYGYVGDRVEYHGGFFDSEKWDKESKQIMPMGRLVVHLLDLEKGEYKASYPGGDKNHLNAGVSFGRLDRIKIGNETYDVQAVEADIFLYLSSGFSFQGEYGRIKRSGLEFGLPGGAPDMNSGGWFAQSGYILPSDVGKGKLEFAYRFQEYNILIDFPDAAVKKHSVGINYYLLEHNMKIQSDYTRTSGKNFDSMNAYQVQLQVDF